MKFKVFERGPQRGTSTFKHLVVFGVMIGVPIYSALTILLLAPYQFKLDAVIGTVSISATVIIARIYSSRAEGARYITFPASQWIFDGWVHGFYDLLIPQDGYFEIPQNDILDLFREFSKDISKDSTTRPNFEKMIAERVKRLNPEDSKLAEIKKGLVDTFQSHIEKYHFFIINPREFMEKTLFRETKVWKVFALAVPTSFGEYYHLSGGGEAFFGGIPFEPSQGETGVFYVLNWLRIMDNDIPIVLAKNSGWEYDQIKENVGFNSYDKSDIESVIVGCALAYGSARVVEAEFGRDTAEYHFNEALKDIDRSNDMAWQRFHTLQKNLKHLYEAPNKGVEWLDKNLWKIVALVVAGLVAFLVWSYLHQGPTYLVLALKNILGGLRND
jgi:hypothetical protein